MFTANWITRKTRVVDTNQGFTLLELVMCMAVLAVTAMGLAAWSVRMVNYHRLLYTRDEVLWTMRWCQQMAVTHGVDSNFRFSVYTPEFSTYLGPVKQTHFTFPAGITYKDGYLQLNTGSVRYSPAGTSQVGGTVRLVDGNDEVEIQLFLGAGLQMGHVGP